MTGKVNAVRVEFSLADPQVEAIVDACERLRSNDLEFREFFPSSQARRAFECGVERMTNALRAARANGGVVRTPMRDIRPPKGKLQMRRVKK